MYVPYAITYRRRKANSFWTNQKGHVESLVLFEILSQFFRQVRRFVGSINMDLMGEGATMIEEYSIYVSLTLIDPLEL